MATFKGNEPVAPGLYFNARELRFASMDDGGRLPGEATETWRAVHPLALLVVGPFVGLVYAIFLPLIAFVMVGAVVVRKLAGMIEGVVRRPAMAVAGPAPGGASTPGPAAKSAPREDRSARS